MPYHRSFSAPVLTTLIIAAAILYATPLSRAQNTAPELPILVEPVQGGQALVNPPTFSAVVAADAQGDPQQIQFGVYMDDTLFVMGSDFLPFANVGDTVTWIPSDTLHENWFYFWTARAFDGTDTTPKFGHLAFFLVNAINEDPSAPDVIAPVGDSLVFNARPTFHWVRSFDPDFYDTVIYQVWSTYAPGDCVLAIFNTHVQDTFYRDTSLLIPFSYFWGVVADDGHGGVTQDGVGLFRVYRPGDVNLSSMVTSADIIMIINYLFRGGALDTPACAADFNLDDIVNSADVISFVNHVFKGFKGPTPACDL